MFALTIHRYLFIAFAQSQQKVQSSSLNFYNHRPQTTPSKMQLIKLFALATLLASGALAVPVAEPEPGKPTKPEKPSPPSINVVSNQCGNGAAPYCCNTDNKGKYTTCKVMGKLCMLRRSMDRTDGSRLGQSMRCNNCLLQRTKCSCFTVSIHDRC